jgi:hypothetical protein
MTPAESLSAEITQNNLPRGARTVDQFNHSQMVSQIVRDIRSNPATGVSNYISATQSGQIRPADDKHIISLLTMKPLEYQVSRMSATDAMRVWDLANSQEGEMLHDRIVNKVSNSKTLSAENKTNYLHVLQAPK